MKTIKQIMLILLISLSIKSFAQHYKKGIEYKLNIEKVKSSNEITWYGWDFSHMRITDPKQFSQAKAIKEQHIPAIIGLLNEQFSLKWVVHKLYTM